MPYSIELPDGAIVEDIPDNITPEQAKARIIAAFPKYAPAPKRTWAGSLGDTAVTGFKGAVGLIEAGVGLADIPANLLGLYAPSKTLAGLGLKPAEAQKILDKMYSPAQQEAEKRVQKAEGFTDTLQALKENPSVIATTAGRTLPQMVGGANIARGITALAPKLSPMLAGAAGEGILGAGSAMKEISEGAKGEVTPEQAAKALLSGAGTAAFGVAGAKASKLLGGADIDTMLAQGARKTATEAAEAVAKPLVKPPGFLSQMARSGFSEGVLEELPQSVQEKMIENWALGKPLTEGVGKAAAMALTVGTAMGVAGGGFSASKAKADYEKAVGEEKLTEKVTEKAKQETDKAAVREERNAQIATLSDEDLAKLLVEIENVPSSYERNSMRKAAREELARREAPTVEAPTVEAETARVDRIADTERGMANIAAIANAPVVPPERFTPAQREANIVETERGMANIAELANAPVPPRATYEPTPLIRQEVGFDRAVPEPRPAVVMPSTINQIASDLDTKYTSYITWFNNNVVGKSIEDVRAVVEQDPKLAQGTSARAKILRELLAPVPEAHVEPTPDVVAATPPADVSAVTEPRPGVGESSVGVPSGDLGRPAPTEPAAPIGGGLASPVVPLTPRVEPEAPIPTELTETPSGTQAPETIETEKEEPAQPAGPAPTAVETPAPTPAKKPTLRVTRYGDGSFGLDWLPYNGRPEYPAIERTYTTEQEVREFAANRFGAYPVAPDVYMRPRESGSAPAKTRETDTEREAKMEALHKKAARVAAGKQWYTYADTTAPKFEALPIEAQDRWADAYNAGELNIALADEIAATTPAPAPTPTAPTFTVKTSPTNWTSPTSLKPTPEPPTAAAPTATSTALTVPESTVKTQQLNKEAADLREKLEKLTAEQSKLKTPSGKVPAIKSPARQKYDQIGTEIATTQTALQTVSTSLQTTEPEVLPATEGPKPRKTKKSGRTQINEVVDATITAEDVEVLTEAGISIKQLETTVASITAGGENVEQAIKKAASPYGKLAAKVAAIIRKLVTALAGIAVALNMNFNVPNVAQAKTVQVTTTTKEAPASETAPKPTKTEEGILRTPKTGVSPLASKRRRPTPTPTPAAVPAPTAPTAAPTPTAPSPVSVLINSLPQHQQVPATAFVQAGQGLTFLGSFQALNQRITKFRTLVTDRAATVSQRLAKKFNNGVRDGMGNVNSELLYRQAEAAHNLSFQFFKQGSLQYDAALRYYKVASDEDVPPPSEVFDLIKSWGAATGRDFKAAYNDASELLEAARLREMRNSNNAGTTDFNLHRTDTWIDTNSALYDADPRLAAMNASMDKTRKALIDEMVAAGRITAEMGDSWKDAVAYVPFDREGSGEALDAYFRQKRRTGRGPAQLGSLPVLKGSTERPIKNVFENNLNTLAWMVTQTVKNRANVEVMRDLQSMPSPQAVELASRDVPDARNNPDRIVTVYIDGVEKPFLLNSTYDVMAFVDRNPPVAGVFKQLGRISNVLRTSITAVPTFSVKQVAEDIQRMALHSGITNVAAASAAAIKNFTAISADELLGKENPAVKFFGERGIVGGVDWSENNSASEFLRSMGVDPRNIVHKGLGNSIYKLDAISRASDLAIRKAIYDQTIEETGDEALALSRAREIINFRKRGAGDKNGWTQSLLTSVTFFNAYVQGTDVLYRSLVGENAVSGAARSRALKMFWSRAALMTAVGIAYALGKEDDDEYNRTPVAKRDKTWMISEGFGIPVASELGILFKVIPERVAEYYRRQGTPQEQVARQAVTTYLRDAAEVYVGRVNPIPTALRPLAEVGMNYSFLTSRPLVGIQQKGVETWAQANSRTSEFAKTVAKYMKINAGVEVSPISIDTYLTGYFGTTASLTLALSDAITHPDKVDRPLHTLQGLAPFMYDQRGQRNLGEFYKLQEKVLNSQRTLDQLAKTSLPEAQTYFEKNKEMLAYKSLVHHTLNQLERSRAFIKDMSSETYKNIPKEEREEKIKIAKEYENRITAWVRDAEKNIR